MNCTEWPTKQESEDQQYIMLLLFLDMMVNVTNNEHFPLDVGLSDNKDDYRRWMPDQIVDPVELVHQIEVR